MLSENIMTSTGGVETRLAELARSRVRRARAIATAGGIEAALASGDLPRFVDATVSEALVLGLLRQKVKRFLVVLGHGSTDVGEVLRIYQEAGLLRVYNVRSEIEASHAATALRWVTGEKAAVVTSIGPGALQALAASIAPASDGTGVWYLLGDETTEDEGFNMQQIPKHEQGLFLRLYETMGRAYSLQTPLALPTALQRGLVTVDHPHRGGPFFLLMPMNTQPASLPGFNLAELPHGAVPRLGAAAENGDYERAADLIAQAERVVVRIGGGARQAGPELVEFLELADAVAVLAPIATGTIPYRNPRNMTVGGSKGSICGNYAMEEADLLVVVGTRSVCQSDCSRTGYPKAQAVININTDLDGALHYNRTLALWGDAGPTLARLNRVLAERGAGRQEKNSLWMVACSRQRADWESFKQERYAHPTLHDPRWGGEVLTQPAAIKIATDWARQHGVVSFFDAGDVQANGFQIVEDERLGQTYTETGASYMGFACSALLATALAEKPFYALAFSGDGSFTMSPQILLDGVEHGAKGCILLFDNRTMGAIAGLQGAQFGNTFAVSDSVAVDYVAWARAIRGVQGLDGGRTPGSLLTALAQARAYDGLTLIHLPVYCGPDDLGGMGVFGRWNVGNWCVDVQAMRHRIGM
jgi:3D-(3,5/4)-trihydroxycyclohexane-1,2-dione acylhydrolase (decyclizing)